MSFFAILFALLIEQLKPLPRDTRAREALVAWLDWSGRNLDAGRAHHAWVVWGVSVVVPSLAAAGVYLLIAGYSVLLALAFDVLVLYLTLGFRQFSHYFTDIRDALDRGDEAQARERLGQWRHLEAAELPRVEVLRHVLEHALVAAHRHVFGVFFCFVLFSALGLGPMGAVLYRLSEFAARHWAERHRDLEASADERLAAGAQRLFALIDHVPARLTAFGFAVVGNFEEAVNAWRRDAVLWMQPNEGVILAAAAGAMGVRLGGRPAQAGQGLETDRPRGAADGAAPGVPAPQGLTEASTPGAPAQLGHLQSVVGLVWRSVVLWMLLLALLTLANVVG